MKETFWNIKISLES